MTTPQLVCHTAVVLALLAAYVVMTVTGHDATALLGLLAGYIGGAGTAAVVARAEGR